MFQSIAYTHTIGGLKRHFFFLPLHDECGCFKVEHVKQQDYTMTLLIQAKHHITKWKNKHGTWSDHPTLLLNKWRVQEVVGGRGRGTVHYADDEFNRKAVVRFVHSSRTSHFGRELQVYQNLREHCFPAGFARFFSSCRCEKTPYIVLERLKKSLGQVMGECRVLSVAEAAKLSIQIVSCLETLHKIGFVHGSISEEHVLFDCEDYSCGSMYLVDFSKSEKFPAREGDCGTPLSVKSGGRITHDVYSIVHP